MGLQYKAAFIIPINTKKILTDTGWNFDSKSFLPNAVVDYLTNNLKLNLDETYLGIKSYINEYLQANIFLDDQGRIEFVNIKIYGNDLDLVLSEFNKSQLNIYAELFIPEDNPH